MEVKHPEEKERRHKTKHKPMRRKENSINMEIDDENELEREYYSHIPLSRLRS